MTRLSERVLTNTAIISIVVISGSLVFMSNNRKGQSTSASVKKGTAYPVSLNPKPPKTYQPIPKKSSKQTPKSPN